MIGIVGKGFVGQAVYAAFSPFHETRVHDVDARRSLHSLEEVAECDVVFLCLPTPSRPDGSCDTSIVESVVAKFAKREKPLVVKSTVTPGTCDHLARKYQIPGLLHSPEFLSARTAIADYLCPARHIIGCGGFQHGDGITVPSMAATELRELYESRFPGIPVHVMQRRESELVKYVQNAFFATKISFFNEMRTLSRKIDADWDTVLSGVMADGRIAHSHTMVPGASGEYGFGGECLPKDISALADFCRSLGIMPYVLAGAMARNQKARAGQQHDMGMAGRDIAAARGDVA